VIQSGAHQTSLQYILNRQVDAAAIDSTVLELICARHPDICTDIRIIATLGPSPMPPWVIGRHVAPALRERIRTLLLHMHEDSQGRAILAGDDIAHFAAVTDHTYDMTRHMLEISAGVIL
jgi:phosphonate transport system substrate-binding protein